VQAINRGKLTTKEAEKLRDQALINRNIAVNELYIHLKTCPPVGIQKNEVDQEVINVEFVRRSGRRQLLSHLVFDRLFKRPHVIIGIKQHALSAIRDDGCPADLNSIHDIKRAIDEGHRDCGAFVVVDPHRSQPKLPSLWIDNSLLISGAFRHCKPKLTAKLTSDHISRQRDAVDGYAGPGGLTECCGG
jgi:hypothetical protein